MGQPQPHVKKRPRILSTLEKAQEINFSGRHYGTIAEIGAGQEVARWFFQAGGAAGTIAKSISAYDMTFSNAIYGKAGRFVSRERLQEMLNHEYRLLVERLGAERGDHTRFFVFADTITARSHKHTFDGKGWLGIRFQTEPNQAPGEIHLHVRLMDPTNAEQMEVLGMLGVNLIHAAFFEWRNPEEVLNRLMDGIRYGRLEVEMVAFGGPVFQRVDSFYNKSVLLLRGHYRPITNFHMRMMAKASAVFRADPDNKGREIVEVCEITMRNLVRSRKAGIEDFLDRVDCMGALKRTVLVTNIFRFHRLSQYLTQRTKGCVGFVIGVPLLAKMLEEQFYSDLPGGILEAMGRLFLPGVKLLVQPGHDPVTRTFVTGHTLTVPEPIREIYEYLVRTGRIVDLAGTEKDLPPCSSSEILRNIRAGKKGWEANVPAPVAKLIRRRRLFGYRAAR